MTTAPSCQPVQPLREAQGRVPVAETLGSVESAIALLETP